MRLLKFCSLLFCLAMLISVLISIQLELQVDKVKSYSIGILQSPKGGVFLGQIDLFSVLKGLEI